SRSAVPGCARSGHCCGRRAHRGGRGHGAIEAAHETGPVVRGCSWLKCRNDQLSINNFESSWPIRIVITISVDQKSIRSCLLYLAECAATLTFNTILINTN